MSKSILLLLLVAAAVFALSGCSVARSVTYANAERYSIGEAEITGKIENMEIDWISGNVQIISYSGSTFLLSEKAESRLPDELRVHWWLEGTTLHVKFAAPKAKLTGIDTGHKELTLTVPESLSLQDVAIRSTSAEIDADGLTAETLTVSTASGDIGIGCTANAINLSSTSGTIQLTQKGKADEISINTTSGKITAALDQADKVELTSISGKINAAAASVDSLSAGSTSGAVSCELAAAPSACKLQAVSGRVTLILPDDSGFTAKVSTSSGDFTSDFALKRDGNSYLCGSGSSNIAVDTTSGDISIRKK